MGFIKQEWADKPLDFGSDLHLRNRFFLPASFAHPAKCHLGFFVWLMERYTAPGDIIGDPMAGIGSSLLASTYQRHVIAREVEAKWLEIMRQNAAHIEAEAGLFAGTMDMGQGDARQPWGFTADHLIFSPPYGNEASTMPSARRMLPYKFIDPEKTLSYSERWRKMTENPTLGTMGAVSFTMAVAKARWATGAGNATGQR